MIKSDHKALFWGKRTDLKSITVALNSKAYKTYF